MAKAAQLSLLTAPHRHGPLAYRRAGSGPPLVLLHGVGLASPVWGPQFQAFTEGHDVVAPDMLGHGSSALPPEGADLASFGDPLADLLVSLDLRDATLVGHSMGALIALDLALRHPGRIGRVVAMNAVFRRSDAQRAAVLARASSLEGVGAGSTATIARWLGDPVPEHLHDAASMLRHMLATVDPAGYSRAYRVFATHDEAHASRLPSLAVPALFLTGELDPNSSPAMSEAMAALAPQGRAEILAGERHMMPLVSPDRVNAAIRRFLDAG